jgi:alkanesulfonate monooxygenase SsuD/methylene tetrahydromethanopterin reductase-like flavin-dependent oxidoreductase (luciferase family)
LAAHYANEWNGVFISPEEFADRNKRLDKLLVKEGRNPDDLRRSIMLGTIYGHDKAEIEKRMPRWAKDKYTVKELKENGILVGAGDELAVQISQYAAAGAQRIMMQWLDLDDIGGLTALAQEVIG